MSKNNGFWKNIIHFLKKPPMFFVVIISILALLSIAGALTFVFVGYMGVFSYIVYALAALLLAYSVYTLVRFMPQIKANIVNLLKRNRLARKMMENYGFRSIVFSSISLIINVGYVVFNMVFAILSKSIWYGASAVYYLLLSCLKGVMFYSNGQVKKKSDENLVVDQWKNYRSCGIFLFVLEIGMAGIITLMILNQKPTKYSDIVAISMAAFTVYKITFAIINILKAYRRNDILIQIFRNIGLAEAGVSLVSLQIALVATFGQDQDMLILNAITGFAMCALTMVMGVFMIVYANRQITKLKQYDVQLNENVQGEK